VGINCWRRRFRVSRGLFATVVLLLRTFGLFRRQRPCKLAGFTKPVEKIFIFPNAIAG